MSVQEYGKVWKTELQSQKCITDMEKRSAFTLSTPTQQKCFQNSMAKSIPPLYTKSIFAFLILSKTKKKKEILHYLLAMDIYAEAHHTTAIFYQVIIDLHQTLCTVAPKIPSFLSSPKFLWKAKKSWAWFGCSWAEVLFWCCDTPKSEVSLKTQLITPPTPLPKYSPAPEKLSENGFQAGFGGLWGGEKKP